MPTNEIAENQELYAVIDIETTGGNSKTDRITEIAIYRFDGEEITDEFTSLVNPECNIPYFITNLTGISNDMVKNAPKFYEIARKIVEFTEGYVFVAHNVNFDYGFIKQEFKNLGFEYSRKQLCTVRMSRKLIPGLPSYSLGNLCKSLEIPIHSRHRAAGDALATVQVLKLLLSRDEESKIKQSLKKISLSGMHPDFNPTRIHQISEKPGVYYFYNQKDELIYVGKSINLKKRIISHFGNEKTPRALQMKSEIITIQTEETGNELIALLKESHEIKKNKPLYNRAQRRSIFTTGLFSYLDQHGYKRLYISKIKSGEQAITTFSSQEEAKKILQRKIQELGLCQKLCGLYQTESACFHHSIGECKGACIQAESAESYNSRVDQLLGQYQFSDQSFLIIDQGRHSEEKSAVLVRNGQYIGFGFFSPDDVGSSFSLICDCIHPYSDNRETHHLIQHYLLYSTNYQLVALEKEDRQINP